VRVTVIMPAYNREEFIEMALRSLLRQSDACELDLLVVDDGSTDSTPEIVNRLARECGHIRLITTENQGVTKARNVGLNHLPPDAEFATFLDSDDISPVNRFRDDLQLLQADPTLDFTYGRAILTNQFDPDTFEPSPGARQIAVRGVQLGAGIFRISFLREMGMFDESLSQSEDLDFLFRIFERNPRYRLTDTICLYYRRHAGNMTLERGEAQKSFMKAIHKSLLRRKRNPELKIPTDFFDLAELQKTRLELAW
jgi:glycosyltransferase involved in cell wall biosynthesis